MSSSSFSNITLDVFRFLESDFEYQVDEVVEKKSESYVSYVNSSLGVGVKLLFDFSYSVVFVFIHRLVDGVLCDNPPNITDDSVLSCFDFNDYLDEDLKLKPAFEYGEDSEYYDEVHGLRNYIEDVAERLLAHGSHILNGDLTMFPDMETIIKNRARRH